MRTFCCPECHHMSLLSDVNRCPYCNKDLAQHTDQYARAHMARCAHKINPYVYSDRPRGRPPTKVRDAETSARVFVRTCANCGRHCEGAGSGPCEKWQVQRMGRCPCCGLAPILVQRQGVCAVICDKCNLKMEDTDRDALLTRWAKLCSN